jgi:uncharacterized protein involved in type VI secretion and phage assembly
MTAYFGKYRGKVENNVDPSQLGRLQVSVPAVLGSGQNSWAMPCTPYAGSSVGWFALPPVNSDVWVEFEQGDPDYPIWSGCFWSSGNAPASPVRDEIKMLKTDSATITIDDTPGSGSIKIETTAGMKIEMSSSGIEINNGQGASIKLQGPKVSVNDTALEVT